MLMPRMFFQLPANNKPSNLFFFFPILIISLVLSISHGSMAAAAAAAAHTKITTIGAIVDDNSRVGKEQKVAMKIAVQNFNYTSTNHKLSLHVQNSGRDPLQAAYAADGLIKEKQVQVIVGMERWQEAALVADVGNRAQVPVLSLAAAAITPPLAALRWPFLVQIAANGTQQMNCTAAIISSYNWKRVIAIYEDDTYGGDSGMVALLSEALQSSGSEIEHRLVFPPFSSLSDPEGFVLREVSQLLEKQSRVFVVLQSSVSLATHLFREAKQLGLMGRDSVWIITDTVSSVLESVNSSVISSMQGALGIETYFSEESASFLDFKGKFQKQFRLDYPDEDNSRPGIHALRAYDSIKTIAQALQNIDTGNNVTSKMLLDNILSSNFVGLSGPIAFADGELSQLPTLRILNVIGKMYNELGFWSSKVGFSDEFTDVNGNASMKTLPDLVIWPGKLKTIPKGWAMPTDTRRLKIVVPGKTSFQKFVKVDWSSEVSKFTPTGFCIQVFTEALKVLDYALPYEFHPVNDTYDGLVNSVANKSYDAAVGDMTILANRSEHVEFTQPYAESGLLMIVPVKFNDDKAWIFTKPFTKELWLVTGVVMLHMMFIVWFLENRSDNSEFRGPWKDQLSSILWFAFSSLFFAHKEKIKSDYTRVVVALWLFVVFVMTSSYQASLTSMLTVSRLDPNVTDIEWLRRNNAKVGCDGDSFVWTYLKDVLHFKTENIKNISSEYNYTGEFEVGNISAAFLEVPYAKVFLKQYCDKYTAAGPVYRFGGLGFVFQKGSPIASDLSKAILTISENGVLKGIDEELLNVSSSCSNSDSTTNADSLNLENFWGLYTISGTTSTICFLLFFISPSANTIWRKIVGFVDYFHNGGGVKSPAGRVPSPSGNRAQDGDERGSPDWELVSPSEVPEHLVGPRPPQIEIPIRTA